MPDIKHLFVLALENRSFDHMFGFSGLRGADAATGRPTSIEGLSGKEANKFGGKTYKVSRGADREMPTDPGHEFTNVVDQLCGPGTRHVSGKPYPAINNSGFVDSYSHSGGKDPAEIMKCYDTARELPVLNALAGEFVLCDRWFSSMPGPTWPNRMFLHGGSSGGLDHSPTTAEIIEWETIAGFTLPKGSVYDQLKKKKVKYHFYAGDAFPMVAALKGIHLTDIHGVDDLKEDLRKKTFPYSYAFIEPSYNVLREYKGSSSQHPLADVVAGEMLVKEVYESLRGSTAWESSALIITWDEHGGFYDHVHPPSAPPPGDTPPKSKYNQNGFEFAQYGVRVPALVVSPLAPKNLIDHRVYDHASVPATLSEIFGIGHLTTRDAKARGIGSLLRLSKPRTDTPTKLPTPATPRVSGSTKPTRPDESVNGGNLPSFLHSAIRQDLLLAGAQGRQDILKRVAGITTRAQAMTYMRDVASRVKTKRGARR